MATRAAPPMPALGSEILTSLYLHRLLSTSQLHAIHAPELTRRRVQMVLAELAGAGYLDRVGVAASAESAWFLSPMGAEAVEGTGVTIRPYRLSPERARGPLQAHTMATNAVGIAFLEAARARGEDFDASGWRHETVHPLSDARKPELLIADAVLDYTVHEDAGGEVLVCRFVELDRASMSVRELAAKLSNYARLYRFHPAAKGGTADPPRGWRDHYPRFPKVMVVMAGKPAPVLARRVRSLLELACRDPQVLGCLEELGISVTTLEELEHQGPFAPIFWRVADPGAPVDVLGRRPTRRRPAAGPPTLPGLASGAGR